MYGWYGRFDSRGQRGELDSTALIDEVSYIPYNEILFDNVASHTALLSFNFRVELEVKPMPTVATEGTPDPESALPISLLLGVGVAVVVAILVVLLIIAIVCVFGRKRNQPKKK